MQTGRSFPLVLEFLRERRWLVLSVVTVALGVFAATLFLSAPSSSVAAPSAEEKKPKAIVQEIQTVDDLKRLLYPAKVEPESNSVVTSDIDGHVRKIFKTLGARVKAGEIIMTIENRDPAFTYSAVPVRAPVDGVLSTLGCQVMSKVAKGEKLFSVMNADTLRVNAEIPAAELSALAAGTLGSFHLVGSETKIPVRVIGLSPVVDPRTGTATAEIEFLQSEPTTSKGSAPKAAMSKSIQNAKVKQSKDAPKFALPAVGSVGQVAFEFSSGKIIMAPESAISFRDGKPTVRVLDSENKSRRREIELGEQREALIVVKSGLNAGEKLVVRANKSIKDGEEVEIDAPKKDASGTNPEGTL